MSNDLISRSELRRNLMIWTEKLRSAGECGGCEVELLQAVIKMVDAQENVKAELVQHGKWKLNPNGIYDDNTWTCSVCGGPWMLIDGNPKDNFMRYCPQCGAKMEE